MYLEDMIGPILIGAAILVVLILFFTFVPLRLYISGHTVTSIYLPTFFSNI